MHHRSVTLICDGSDGQGDDPLRRDEVREGAPRKAQGAPGRRPRHGVGGARQEAAHRGAGG